MHHSVLHTGASLNAVIADVTGIPDAVLRDYDKSQYISTSDKFKWVRGRDTTYEEDKAYCLIGIFDLSMRISYGGVDAGKKAWDRLLAKIEKANYSIPRVKHSPSQTGSSNSRSGTSLSESSHSLTPDFTDLADQLSEVADQLNTGCYGRTQSRLLSRLADSCVDTSILLRRLDSLGQEDASNVLTLIQCMQTYGKDRVNIQSVVEQIQVATSCPVNGVKTYIDHQTGNVENLLNDLELSKTSLQVALSIHSDQKRTLMQMEAHMLTMATQMSRASQQAMSIYQGLTNPSPIPASRQIDLHPANTTGKIGSGTVVKHDDALDDPMEAPLRIKMASKPVFHVTIGWGWFSSRVWDLTIMRAQSGFDVCFRVPREVPWNAEVFMHCREGNVDAVRRLLDTGAATLQDFSCTSRYTLLSVNTDDVSAEISDLILPRRLLAMAMSTCANIY